MTDHAAIVLALARHHGCTCTPEIVSRPDPRHRRIRHVELRHDDWCPLLVRLERRN